MQLGRLNGRIASADTGPLNTGEKIEAWFEADGAIDIGDCVKLDYASDSTGKLVIATSAVLDHIEVVGIYEGQGGTGAKATATQVGDGHDPDAQAAVDGDIILVTIYGVAIANQNATTDTVAGEALAPDGTTAGHLSGGITGVTNGEGNPAQFVCMVARTDASDAGPVYVKCM